MEIGIKRSDILFVDSPDPGRNCLCSRCQKPIMDGAIRCWPEDGGEYRYHAECVGMKSFLIGFDDDFDE